MTISLNFLFIPGSQSLLKESRVISRLFFERGPSAIFFAVVAVVINSVNRSLFFAKSLYMELITSVHVFLKILKKGPSIFYTPAAVTMVFWAFGVFATCLHRAIDVVKTCSRHTVGLIEKSYLSAATLTPARLGFSVSQGTTRYQSGSAAVTNTFPHEVSPFVLTDLTNNSKFSEDTIL